MIRALIARIRQGHRTMPYPAAPLLVPERFRGYPVVSSLEQRQNMVDKQREGILANARLLAGNQGGHDHREQRLGEGDGGGIGSA